MKRLLILPAISMLAAFSSFSQTPAVTGSIGFPGTAFAGGEVTGAPYSAQQVDEHTQTLADGTNIVQQPRTVMMYRDGQGRTRTERPGLFGPNQQSGPVVIEIKDPVAGYQYILDSEAHVAHRVVLTKPNVANQVAGVRSGTLGAVVPPPPAPPPSGGGGSANATSGPVITGQWFSFVPEANAAGVASATKREHTSESLGTQVTEGVSVTGRRTTTIIPVGAQGNDRPMTIVNETWYSPDLQLMVMTKYTDPRNGENTTRLTNLIVGEPDPALFQPPADYTVVDETGQFQIHFTRPQ